MHLNYISARLVTGSRWYIVYYQSDPLTDKRIRFRETYDLNRIPDIRERRRKAYMIIEEINSKLPLGYPFSESNGLGKTNIIDALEKAGKIKCMTDRKRTIDMVRSTLSVFYVFLAKKQLQNIQISLLDSNLALEFLDYVAIDRGVGGRTYNNYIERMRAICTELVDRNFLQKNPFSGLRKKKVSGKKRRAFSKMERIVVARAILKQDRWLMLGVLLQYYCFIRPIELRRLRFYMVDLNAGVIRLTENETKNRENAIVTIPDIITPFLRDCHFDQWHQRWLIFGARMEPHPDKSCGHNTMNYRHKKILEKLQKAGMLVDIVGLTYYSWKDTGALALFEKKVNMLEIMKQLRHKDLKTTQLYCESLYSVNQEIKTLDNNIIESKDLLMLD